MQKISVMPDTVQIKQLDSICFNNRNNDQDLAIKCGEKALEIARSGKHIRLETRTLNVVGLVYRAFGNYEKSIDCFIKAYKTSSATRDTIEMGYAENNLGHTYRMKGYFRHSIEHSLNGYNIFQSIKNKPGMAYSCIGLGNFYTQQKEYSRALEYYNRSLEIRKELNDRPGQLIALSNIGDVYARKGDSLTAFQYFRRVENGYREIKNESGIAEVYGSMGNLYLKLNDFSKALHYTSMAANLASRVGNLSSQISKLKNLALIYAGLGLYNEGELKINEAIKLAKQYKDDYLSLGCYQTMSEFMEKKGDLKEAYRYLKLSSDLHDTLTAREILAGTAEIELIYKNEKAWREKNSMQTNLEAERRENDYLLIMTLLLVFSIFILYWRFRFRKKLNQHLSELNAAKDKFFSIIAHDLKNPFLGLIGISSALEEEIKSGNFENITEYAELLKRSTEHGYELLDNLLEWSRIQTDRLEIHMGVQQVSPIVKSTVGLLMPAAIDKDITIKSDIPESLCVMADVNILAAVIRNLLSNAIKYSMDGGHIELLAEERAGMVRITVKDDGLGISREIKEKLFRIDTNISTPGTRKERGTGLGLILCREFVTKMGGTIDVESEPGKGACFSFTIHKADLQPVTAA
ncbi:MAG: tetratricopeptide repeat protein [Syntrophothermus sp.]